MADETPVLIWQQPTPNTYETVWVTKRLMIRKEAEKVWICWVEYANTKRGTNPICTTTCATRRAAQAWCADIVMLAVPIHRTKRTKSRMVT
jgi:prephenate dehydrogenase